MNLYYVSSLPGMSKAVTRVFGLLSVSLMSFAYDRSSFNNLYKFAEENPIAMREEGDEDEPDEEMFDLALHRELYFLSASIVCLLLSLGFFLHHLLNEGLAKCQHIKHMDIGYHAIGAVLLMSGACLAVSSATEIALLETQIEIDDVHWDSFQYERTKIAAGIFGALNSLAYAFTSFITAHSYCRNQTNNETKNSTIML